MTDTERKQRSDLLKEMLESSGGKILFEHIAEKRDEAWYKFLSLPVEQKTDNAAFEASGIYKAYEDLVEWILSEIRVGVE